MPEGPEIRRAADRLAKVLVGTKIAEVYFAFPALRKFEKRITGSTVVAVDTRGKAMLTRFDNGLTLYSHNQLYGVWMTARRGAPPETGRSLRVALHTETRSALLYSASDVGVLTDEEVAAHPFLSGLGPDILDRGLSAADVLQRLMHPRFRARSVASLYLDQSFLAGVGNYLRSEILHCAGVHPAERPGALADRLRRLARTTLTISRRAYRNRGVTLTPERARLLRRRGIAYDQYRFWVYGREDQPCRACGARVLRTTAAGRGLFYCPVCQAPWKGGPGG